MTYVKVFADKQKDTQTDGQADKQISQKLYTPNLSMRGHKNLD